MATDFREELRILVDTKLGLPVHGLHFVPRELLAAGDSALLVAVGLRAEDQIKFESKDTGYGAKGVLAGSENRAFYGMTVCLRRGSDIDHHVFVQADNPRSTAETDEDRELDKVIQQVVALVHEFGHVRDMSQAINFQFFPQPTAQLARAEAEAHGFTFDYLNKRGLHQLRASLAKALFRLSAASSNYERALYAALCQRVGKGRLKRWAAAA